MCSGTFGAGPLSIPAAGQEILREDILPARRYSAHAEQNKKLIDYDCWVISRSSLTVDGRKSDRPSESKKKRKERARLWRLLHIERHLCRHAHRLRCYTPRQRQAIEHFHRAGRCKFGTLLEYPVEIFGRNRILIFSTSTLPSGLRAYAPVLHHSLIASL